MCYLRDQFCLCCWKLIKTLKINFCSRPLLCKSRVVYSKIGLCEWCFRCPKPCSIFAKIPRRWTEKKRHGHFVKVEGFEFDPLLGTIVALGSSNICPYWPILLKITIDPFRKIYKSLKFLLFRSNGAMS